MAVLRVTPSVIQTYTAFVRARPKSTATLEDCAMMMSINQSQRNAIGKEFENEIGAMLRIVTESVNEEFGCQIEVVDQACVCLSTGYVVDKPCSDRNHSHSRVDHAVLVRRGDQPLHISKVCVFSEKRSLRERGSQDDWMKLEHTTPLHYVLVTRDVRARDNVSNGRNRSMFVLKDDTDSNRLVELMTERVKSLV